MQALFAQRETLLKIAQPLSDVLNLLIRFYLAKVFFMSGLTKLRDWETTVFLFQEEYRVPLLSPELAAFFGTAGELVLPVLLLLGLAGRLAGLGLFVLNIVAVVSYYHVLSEVQSMLDSHFYWGLLLAVVVLYGPGRLAVDHWLCRRCQSA